MTLFACLATAEAQSVDGADVNGLRLRHSDDHMIVNMNVNFSSLNVPSNRVVLFTPILTNGRDSLELPAVGVYGRRRHIYNERNNKNATNSKKELSYRSSQTPEQLAYNVIVPYKSWMDGALLLFQRSDCGCCNKVLSEQTAQIGSFKERFFTPQYVYLRPAEELEKSRSISGSAYVDFVVNRVDINPAYRNNKVELSKITATIDSVRNDADITLNAISIKGFASPEGSYDNNANLAEKRTEALKKYVQNLYEFDADFIETEHEPEDWANLRRFVEASELPNKEAILAIIDSSREPDNKEWHIRSSFADDYQVMYRECYPGLRRSDYKVEYTIRHYKDVEEIKMIFEETPQKLSLEEFYILAQEYEDNSRELNDIFETAVRMYPNDPIANLNAAISEMQNGDLTSAEPHLVKAGSSPEAVYARGIYAAFVKNYEKALDLLQKAKEQGVEAAADAIEQINEIK